MSESEESDTIIVVGPGGRKRKMSKKDTTSEAPSWQVSDRHARQQRRHEKRFLQDHTAGKIQVNNADKVDKALSTTMKKGAEAIPMRTKEGDEAVSTTMKKGAESIPTKTIEGQGALQTSRRDELWSNYDHWREQYTVIDEVLEDTKYEAPSEERTQKRILLLSDAIKTRQNEIKAFRQYAMQRYTSAELEEHLSQTKIASLRSSVSVHKCVTGRQQGPVPGRLSDRFDGTPAEEVLAYDPGEHWSTFDYTMPEEGSKA